MLAVSRPTRSSRVDLVPRHRAAACLGPTAPSTPRLAPRPSHTPPHRLRELASLPHTSAPPHPDSPSPRSPLRRSARSPPWPPHSPRPPPSHTHLDRSTLGDPRSSPRSSGGPSSPSSPAPPSAAPSQRPGCGATRASGPARDRCVAALGGLPPLALTSRARRAARRRRAQRHPEQLRDLDPVSAKVPALTPVRAHARRSATPSSLPRPSSSPRRSSPSTTARAPTCTRSTSPSTATCTTSRTAACATTGPGCPTACLLGETLSEVRRSFLSSSLPR